MKKKKISFIIALISGLILLCGLVMATVNIEDKYLVNYPRDYVRADGVVFTDCQIANLANDKEWAYKKATDLVGKFVLNNGSGNTTSMAGSGKIDLRQHIFCAHQAVTDKAWSHSSGSIPYKIVAVLDIGFTNETGEIRLRNPTKIIGYNLATNGTTEKKEGFTPLAVYLSQQAWRTEQNDDTATIDRIIESIRTNLYNSKIINDNVNNILKGRMYNDRDGATQVDYDSSLSSGNYSKYNYYKNQEFKPTSIYNNTKDMNDGNDLGKLVLSDPNDKKEAKVIGSNIVGPFKLKVPKGKDVKIDASGYTICDKSGKSTSIVSDKEFYLKFSGTIPRTVKFSCSYKQYYARVIISLSGGNMVRANGTLSGAQDRWIFRGRETTNKSEVEYKIIDDDDLGITTTIYSANSIFAGQELYSDQSNVYVEEGDVLTVDYKLKNNHKTSTTNLEEYYTNFYFKKPSGDPLLHMIEFVSKGSQPYDSNQGISYDNFSQKINDNMTDFTNTYRSRFSNFDISRQGNIMWKMHNIQSEKLATWKSNKYLSIDTYKDLKNYNFSPGVSISQKALFYVRGKQLIGDIDSDATYFINGKIEKKDSNMNNNSDTKKYKFRTIGGDIEQVIKSINHNEKMLEWEWDKISSPSLPLVKENDIIEFAIRVKNTGGYDDPLERNEAEENTVSKIYRSIMTIKIPQELKVLKVNGVEINYNKQSTYDIFDAENLSIWYNWGKNEAIFGVKETIKFKDVKELVVFECQVKEEEFKLDNVLTSVAELDNVRNRNDEMYNINKTSPASVRLKTKVGAKIEKKVVSVESKKEGLKESDTWETTSIGACSEVVPLVEWGDTVKYEVKLTNTAGETEEEMKNETKSIYPINIFYVKEKIPKGMKLTHINDAEVSYMHYCTGCKKGVTDIENNHCKTCRKSVIEMVKAGSANIPNSKDTVYYSIENKDVDEDDLYITCWVQCSNGGLKFKSSQSMFFTYVVDEYTMYDTSNVIENTARLTRINIQDVEFDCSAEDKAFVKLKQVDSEIEKDVYKIFDEDGKEFKETGQYVDTDGLTKTARTAKKNYTIQYKVKITNTGKLSEVEDITNPNEVAKMYNTTFKETIPEGLEFNKVTDIDENEIEYTKESDGIYYTIPEDIVFRGESKEFIFEYKVNNDSVQYVMNVATLISTENRNEKEIEIDKPDEEIVLIVKDSIDAGIKKEVLKKYDENHKDIDIDKNVRTGYFVDYKVTITNNNDFKIHNALFTDDSANGDLELVEVTDLLYNNLQENTTVQIANEIDKNGGSISVLYRYKVKGTVKINETRPIINTATLISVQRDDEPPVELNKPAQAEIILENPQIPIDAEITKEVLKKYDENHKDIDINKNVRTGYYVDYKVTITNNNDFKIHNALFTDDGANGDLELEEVTDVLYNKLQDNPNVQIANEIDKNGGSISVLYRYKVKGTVKINETRPIINTATLISVQKDDEPPVELNKPDQAEIILENPQEDVGIKINKRVKEVRYSKGESETTYDKFTAIDDSYSEDNIKLAEYGDVVDYEVTLKNTGGYTENQLKNDSYDNPGEDLKTVTFEEEIPQELILKKIIVGNSKTEELDIENLAKSGKVNKLYADNGKDVFKYSIKKDGDNRYVTVELSREDDGDSIGLAFKKSKSIVFEYVVKSQTIEDIKDPLEVSNTAKLTKMHVVGRDESESASGQSTAKIKIKRMGADISKKVYQIYQNYTDANKKLLYDSEKGINSIAMKSCEVEDEKGNKVTKKIPVVEPGYTVIYKISTLNIGGNYYSDDNDVATINAEIEETNPSELDLNDANYSYEVKDGVSICDIKEGIPYNNKKDITFRYTVKNHEEEKLVKNVATLKSMYNRNRVKWYPNISKNAYIYVKPPEKVGAEIVKTVNSVHDEYGNDHTNEKDGELNLVEEGDTVEYNVSIKNTENSVIKTIEFDDNAQIGLKFKSIDGASYTIDGNTIKCKIEDLELKKGDSVDVKISFKVETKLTIEELKEDDNRIIPNTVILTKVVTATQEQYPNISSTVNIKLKTIDADVTKTLEAINNFDDTTLWDWDNSESKEIPLVECGDTLRYAVTIANTEESETLASNIKKFEFIEEIPEGLNFEKATYDKNLSIDISDYTDDNEKNYKKCIVNTVLKPGDSITIRFYYKVNPDNTDRYIGINQDNHYISNTAYLQFIYNRNDELPYEPNKESTVEIRIAKYEGKINKYLYKRYNELDPKYLDATKAEFFEKQNFEYMNPSRESFSEEEKNANPYYVEIGDVLTYRIVFENKGEGGFSNIHFDDKYIPKELEYINTILEASNESLSGITNTIDNNTATVTGDISTEYKIPQEFSSIEEQGKDTYRNYTLSKGQTLILNINFKVVKTLVNTEELSIFNTAEFIEIENRNNWTFKFDESSEEHAKEKIYNIKADKYIVDYDRKMMKDNIDKGLITLDDENDDYYEGDIDKFLADRKDLSDDDKKLKAFAAEKNETLTYRIKINNTSSNDKSQDTKIIVENISDSLSEGLEAIEGSFTAKIYEYDWAENKHTLIKEFKPTINGNLDSTFTINLDEYKTKPQDYIKDEYKIKPQDYIEVEYKVKVTSSNTNLKILENVATLSKLINVNRIPIIDQTTNTDTNLNKQKIITSEYVKLKELVISGYVWNDIDKNGLMDTGELGINGITVYLRNPNLIRIVGGEKRHTKNLSADETDLITTTNINGLYTFGRIRRTDNDNNYKKDMHIEYVYNGIKYQSTLYSGKSNINDEDMGIGDNYIIDSNAKEFNSSRMALNNDFKTIYNNNASSTFDKTPSRTMIYNKSGTISIIQGNGEVISAYSFVNSEQDGDKIDSLFLGNVDSASYQTEYLKHINLGLKVRDKLDIEITENIEEITNTVFGDSIGYILKKDKNEESTNDKAEEITDDKTEESTYDKTKDKTKFEYYPADYFYKYTDYQNDEVKNALTENSELTSQITYKAQVHNTFKNDLESITPTNDSNVAVTVNEIALYLSNKYEVETDGNGKVKKLSIRKLDSNELYFTEEEDYIKAYYMLKTEDGTVKEEPLEIYNYSIYNTALIDSVKSNVEGENGYKALYIRPNQEQKGKQIILPNDGSMVDIYLTFTDCNRSYSNRKIDLGIYNHTLEINSYSTYYKENGDYVKGSGDGLEVADQGAGYIDIDSNPGNVGCQDGYSNAQSASSEYAFGDSEESKKYDEDDTCRGDITLLAYGVPTEGENPNDLVRTINGMVFDDCRSEEVTNSANNDDIQYVGDGTFNQAKKYQSNARTNILLLEPDGSEKEQKDIPVPDVKVNLYKRIKIKTNDGEIRYYNVDLQDSNQYQPPKNEDGSLKITWSSYERSDENGEYKLRGFTPGNHFVRFNYGNTPDKEDDDIFKNAIIFNGQDYKSTTLTNLEDYWKIEDANKIKNDDINKLRDYRNQVISYITGKGTTTKALDDPQRRMETNLYASEINNIKSEILNAGQEYLRAEDNDKEKDTYKSLAEVMLMGTNMFADSIEFYTRAEYEKYNGEDIRNNVQYIQLSKRKDFDLKEVNLGIQYRPETELTLKEYIKEIKLDSQVGNGTEAKTLIDIHYREDRTIDTSASNIGLDYLLAMSSSYKVDNNRRKYDYEKGFQYLNIDERFLQGATIYVTYGIYIDNTGEIDRVSSSFNVDNSKAGTKTNLLGSMQEYKAEILDKYSEIEYTDENGIITGKYLQNIKSSDDYMKYLGGTYYFGQSKSKDDAIAQAKVDQVISDLELETDFNAQAYSNQWTYYEDMQDIIKGGTYSIISKYNLKKLKYGDSINDPEDYKPYELNYNKKYDGDFGIITDVLKRNYYLYDEFREIYGKDAFFEKWFKHLVKDFEKSAVVTNADGKKDSLKLGRLIEPYTNALFEGEDKNQNYTHQILLEVNKALIGSHYHLSGLDDYSKIQANLANLSENVKLYNNNYNSKQPVKIKKTISIERDSLTENTGYNTTYRFTTPDIIFAPKNVPNPDETVKPKMSTIQYTDPTELDSERKKDSRVGLDLVTQKVLSADILSTSALSFDNITEIIKYTTSNGRRTVYNSVGNGTECEIDTDETVASVILSGPTGLSEKEQVIEKAKYSVEVIIIIGLSIVAIGVIIISFKRI